MHFTKLKHDTVEYMNYFLKVIPLSIIAGMLFVGNSVSAQSSDYIAAAVRAKAVADISTKLQEIKDKVQQIKASAGNATSSTAQSAEHNNENAAPSLGNRPELIGIENAVQHIQNLLATLSETASSSPMGLQNALARLECITINRNLSKGVRGNDVAELQRTLIARGHLSEGNDTGYFGDLTRQAVREFQIARGIANSGSEETTGFGAVGPRTRSALASCNN